MAAGALAALVAFPLARLFGTAFRTDPMTVLAGLRTGRTAEAAANTLWTSAAVTVLAVVAAVAAAWVTERAPVPGRRALRLALVVPLLVPPYVSALSWIRAYGPVGLSERIAGFSFPGLYGPAGIVAVLTVNALPLAYLVVAASLASRVEPDLERAARASGASATRAFGSVTLPLLRPALVAASALVFVTTANAFGVPAILGRPAGFGTVTTRIYEDLVLSADLAAFSRVLALACGLVILAVVVVGTADARVGERFRGARTGAPAGAAPKGPRAWWPAAGVWCYVAVTVALPLAALVLMALTRAVGLAPTPGNWTLAHFGTAIDGAARPALANSLILALAAAALVVCLGGLLASLRGRRFTRLQGTAAVLTFAVPGSALAVAVLLAYGGWLRDTLTLILVAYVAKLWALGHRPIAAALEGVPADLLRAARASGAAPRVVLRTVTVPLLAPAVVAAALLVFFFAFHELTMSALLYGPGTETIAVVILNLQQLGDVLATSALAVLLTTAALAVGAALLALDHVSAARLRRR